MAKEPHLEIIASDGNLCGESTIWDAEKQRLLWTDIDSEIVYEFAHEPGGTGVAPVVSSVALETGAGEISPTPVLGATPKTTGVTPVPPRPGEKKILSRGLKVSGIGLNRSGELIFCGRGSGSGLHIWRKQDDFRTVVSLHENVKLSFNDMIIDPQGRAYVGALHWGAKGLEKTGELFLVNCDGSLRIVDDGVEMANGLGFSPDNRTLYFADTSARKIYAYDVNAKTGDLSNKRLFVRVPNEEGMPDGLTVDAEGFIWSAQWYGAQVVRYDPDGKMERRIKLPVTQITNVAFGGKDLNELYISSAAGGWKGPYAPPGFDFEAGNWGGSLYRVKMDICGKLEHRANFS